jgi:hypothetical protein
MNHPHLRLLVLLGAATLLCGAFAAYGQSGDIGFLKAKVSPGRAGVFVDGKYLGPAANFRIARKYPVGVGEHELRLVDPRYEEYTTKFSVKARKTAVVSETLKALPAPKPPFGVLRTENADKFAAVYVNGKFCGHVDEFSNSLQGLLLNPGEYDVKIVPVSGGTPVEKKVTIRANEKTLVK